MQNSIKQEKICLNVSLRNKDLYDTIEYLQTESKLTMVDTIARILRKEKKIMELEKQQVSFRLLN